MSLSLTARLDYLFPMAMGKQRCSDPLQEFLLRRSGKGHESTNQNLLWCDRPVAGCWWGDIIFPRQHKRSSAAEYNPQINPADFTTEITNKYFALPVGKKLTYETTEQGRVTERIEIEILPETRDHRGC